MAAPDPGLERRALLRSIAITAVLGSLGVVWGLASGSQMILLDGVYAAIGIVMTWLMLRASKLADRGPTGRYPYGRESVTPLVIGVQGFVMMATLLYALVEAVFTIVDGGSDVTPGVAMAYAAVSSITSASFWWWLRANAETSDLVTAEATAWRVGTMRGAGMLFGFTLLWILTDSAWDGAAPYIDPVMVLITCAASLSAPVRMVRGTIVELLEGAPPAEVQAPVHLAVDEVFTAFDISNRDVRMTKVGPKLYVEIEADVDPDVTVGTEDAVRRALSERLTALPYDLWLNFELRPHRPDLPDVASPPTD